MDTNEYEYISETTDDTDYADEIRHRDSDVTGQNFARSALECGDLAPLSDAASPAWYPRLRRSNVIIFRHDESSVGEADPPKSEQRTVSPRFTKEKTSQAKLPSATDQHG